MLRRSTFRVALCVFVSCVAPAAAAEPTNFERDVLPIFKRHCFACHSGETNLPKAGLRLDEASAILDHLSAGDPQASNLFDRVTRDASDKERMPPDGPIPPLSPAETETVRAWIKSGADFGGWTKTEPTRRRDYPAAEPKPVNVAEAAKEIDRLIETRLASLGKAPNPPADDATFLRRVHLDAIGRVPTLAESRRFLDSTDPDKRSKLIDELLASEGYVSRFFHVWADALRVQSNLSHARSGATYIWWIKQTLRDNLPYDEFVRRALVAKGHDWEDPAVGHYFRDADNRLARVEATAEIFLGTQIGCAQCHNHPYDVWTRGDYHRFAAFFFGPNHYVPDEKIFPHVEAKDVLARERELRQQGVDKREWACREADLATMSWAAMQNIKSQVVRQKRYWPSLPGDYQYDDTKPKQGIEPAYLFGTGPDAQADEASIEALAAWLTSPKNPKFTLTVVNRLWATVMGAPVAGELTSVKSPDDCRNPELVRYLVQLMIDLKYDRKAFLRVVLNTQTYQRRANAAALGVGEESDFAGPELRRLTAEQAWDSLLTLKFPDLDATISFERPDRSLYGRLKSVQSVDEYWAILEKERDEGRGYVATFNASQVRAGKVRAAGFLPEDLKRASELPSPAPDGHFLRLFGQSDRETADAAWANPTTPQALALMNGPLLDVVLADDSALAQAARSAENPREQARLVFLAVLTREPTEAELDAATKKLEGDGRELWKSLAWTLLNTRRFLFVP